MSYIDAYINQSKDLIEVVERINGSRIYKTYPAEYIFYYDDPNGDYTTMYNTKVSRVLTKSKKAFNAELARYSHKRVWESDCRPLFRCLDENYKHLFPPKLNVAFFDIETDWDSVLGFAPISDPFNKITAISVYLQWQERMITLAIPPKSMPMSEAQEITDKFSDCFVFEKEKDLLSSFLDIIDDADVLSGWNSEGYDIPYIVGRIMMILGKAELKTLCLWDKMPTKKEIKTYGSDTISYNLSGRVHLDYMQLYQKYTFEERHSYSLNAIGEYEECGQKTDYDGTLDQLYNQNFELFLKYNRQDVNLLNALDKKLKFIDLANIVAHECGVLLPDILGTVVSTDQAIINESHIRNLIVPNKRKPSHNVCESVDEKEAKCDEKAAGAYVATPKTGIHQYIGLTDINSLYPNIIRALNMGIDTLIGQIDQSQMTLPYLDEKIKDGASFAEAWDGLFGSLEYTLMMDMSADINITINWENGEKTTDSAKNIYTLLFKSNKPWIVSANGTIYTTEFDGVIPCLLSKWYSDRKVFQKKLKNVNLLESGIYIPDDILSQIDNISSTDSVGLVPFDYDLIGDYIETHNIGMLKSAMANSGLIVKDKKLVAKTSDVIGRSKEFWDKKQYVKKIQLNALYGCLLNSGSRFNDQRLGQSITLSGRAIARHMDATINEMLTGEYDHTGETIIYGDTDSCMFSVWNIIKDRVEKNEIEWSKDICIELYQQIAQHVNDSFPEMTKLKFNTNYGELIKCGLELIGSTGFFIKKKRYAIMVYYKEGDRYDLISEEKSAAKKIIFNYGKVKAMGLDLKRSDTPKMVQDFLMSVLVDVLIGTDRNDIFAKIIKFKMEYANLPSWEKGTPKRVNNLTDYTAKVISGKKCMIPGHVMASINYNLLKKLMGDNHISPIIDGAKINVCKLKNNDYGYNCIAYPIELTNLPHWLTSLPYDDERMEDANVTKKLDNLLGILNWDVDKHTETRSTFANLFA